MIFLRISLSLYVILDPVSSRDRICIERGSISTRSQGGGHGSSSASTSTAGVLERCLNAVRTAIDPSARCTNAVSNSISICKRTVKVLSYALHFFGTLCLSFLDFATGRTAQQSLKPCDVGRLQRSRATCGVCQHETCSYRTLKDSPPFL